MTGILATALVLALAAPAITHAQDTLTIPPGTPPTELAAVENFTGTVRVGSRFRPRQRVRRHRLAASLRLSSADLRFLL
jgi:hypothetical protein